MTKRGLTPNGAEIVDALNEFFDTLKEGYLDALATRYTSRRPELDLSGTAESDLSSPFAP
jgi:hypothetical protein